MPRVLIADDNHQNAELLEAHLEGTGWETSIATDGDATLAATLTWKPDVVLLDVMMPKLSGFEVCQRIRSDATVKNTGIIMVTALDQKSDMERAINVGTDDFLTKPMNKAELIFRVRALIEAGSHADDVDRGLAYFRRATAL